MVQHLNGWHIWGPVYFVYVCKCKSALCLGQLTKKLQFFCKHKSAEVHKSALNIYTNVYM
jgi:hypothetical protein